MAMVGFDASVQAIIKHRKANLAITQKHGLAIDPHAVALELEKYTKLRLGITDPEPSFFQSSRSSFVGAVAAAGTKFVSTVRKLGTGIATLADWLGGQPVSLELSEHRASICVGCPQNQNKDLTSIFTEPVARLIRSQLKERMALKLTTSQDDKLGVCIACGCPLKLKVHVPMDYIKAHIKKPDFDALDPRCWMRHET